MAFKDYVLYNLASLFISKSTMSNFKTGKNVFFLSFRKFFSFLRYSNFRIFES